MTRCGGSWAAWARRLKKTLFAKEQDRPDVIRRRNRWLQHRIDPRRMVFIDETWAKTNMTCPRGWHTRGEALIDKVPHGHWKTLTFIARLRHDGIVVVDNLGSHKGRHVRKLLKAAGIRLFFLPPYAPDLNPIEQMFSKPKRLVQKTNARSIEATWQRIGNLLNHFPPAECANYIRSAGYASI